jgi:hypothetical protein
MPGGSSITAGGASGCACRSVPTGSGRQTSGTYATESPVQDTNRSHLHRTFQRDSQETAAIRHRPIWSRLGDIRRSRRCGATPKPINSRQMKLAPCARTLWRSMTATLPQVPQPRAGMKSWLLAKAAQVLAFICPRGNALHRSPSHRHLRGTWLRRKVATAASAAKSYVTGSAGRPLWLALIVSPARALARAHIWLRTRLPARWRQT